MDVACSSSGEREKIYQEGTQVGRAAPAMTARIATTVNDLSRAHRLVAGEYARLGRSPLDINQVYQEFFPSQPLLPPMSHERVTTVVTSNGDHVVATMALSWCRPGTGKRRYAQIDALRLLRPSTTWIASLRFAPDRIGELTRFAIRRDYQGATSPETKLRFIESMLAISLELARQQGVGIVLGIMPPLVSRLVAKTGFAVSHVEGVDLAHGDAHCDAVYKRYPRYWLPDDPRRTPKLYAVGNPDESLAIRPLSR